MNNTISQSETTANKLAISILNRGGNLNLNLNSNKTACYVLLLSKKIT